MKKLVTILTLIALATSTYLDNVLAIEPAETSAQTTPTTSVQPIIQAQTTEQHAPATAIPEKAPLVVTIPNKINSLACSACSFIAENTECNNKSFTHPDQAEPERSIQQATSQENPVDNESSETNATKETNKTTNVFTCQHCDAVNYTKSSLSIHIKDKHPEIYAQSCICNYCKKKFSQPSTRIIHERKHTGEKPFTCAVCSEAFSVIYSLNRHTQSKHSSIGSATNFQQPIENSHEEQDAAAILSSLLTTTIPTEAEKEDEATNLCICQHCDFVALSKRKLSIHTQDKHPEIYAESCICNYCKKNFSQPSTRIIHERNHTGEKPFTCAVCSKAFSVIGSLNRHILRAHSPINTGTSVQQPIENSNDAQAAAAILSSLLTTTPQVMQKKDAQAVVNFSSKWTQSKTNRIAKDLTADDSFTAAAKRLSTNLPQNDFDAEISSFGNGISCENKEINKRAKATEAIKPITASHLSPIRIADENSSDDEYIDVEGGGLPEETDSVPAHSTALTIFQEAQKVIESHFPPATTSIIPDNESHHPTLLTEAETLDPISPIHHDVPDYFSDQGTDFGETCQTYEPTQPEESLQAAASIELPAHDELSNTTAQPDTETPSSEPNASPSAILPVDGNKSDNEHIDSAETEDPEATSEAPTKYSTALTVFHEPREIIESHFPPAIPSMPTDNQSEPLASAQPADNDLVCNECGFIAVSKRGLATHIGKTHQDPATASTICQYCNKILSDKWKLARHVEKLHSNKCRKNFSCTICSLEFVSSEACSRHILQHNDKGDKKFKCDTCGVGFKKCRGYKNHLRLHKKPVSNPTVASSELIDPTSCQETNIVDNTEMPSTETNSSLSPILGVNGSKSDSEYIDSVETEEPEATAEAPTKYSTALTVFHEPREIIESHFPPAIAAIITNQSADHSSMQTNVAVEETTASAFDPDSADTPEQTEFYDYDYEPTQPEESLRAAASIELPAHDELSNTTAQPDTETPSTETDSSPSLSFVVTELHDDGYEPTQPEENLEADSSVEESAQDEPITVISAQPAKSDRTVKKSHICTVCGKGYPKPNLLQKHLLKHSAEKSFKCTICNLGFDTDIGLNIHKGHFHSPKDSEGLESVIAQEQSILSLQCEQCPFVASDLRELSSHMKSKHKKTPFLQCRFCRAKFPRLYDLQRHLRTHTGEKPFKCAICPLSFNRKDLLLNHMRYHDDDKPFECTGCKIRFDSALGLTHHIRQSHQNKGEKPTLPLTDSTQEATNEEQLAYDKPKEITSPPPPQNQLRCQECDFIGISKLGLAAHIGKKHRDLIPQSTECQYCHAVLADRWKLSRHIQDLHLNKKEFTCSVCNLVFQSSKACEKHILQHSAKNDAKKFKCATCGVGFDNYRGYHHHQRLHAKNASDSTLTSPELIDPTSSQETAVVNNTEMPSTETNLPLSPILGVDGSKSDSEYIDSVETEEPEATAEAPTKYSTALTVFHEP
ncbi:hypothetical protein FJ365_02480, partial [Candidatus Dependentiae bacterium]|nr:hypothetical protein [Candidatus Dependentiae bacterium]